MTSWFLCGIEALIYVCVCVCMRMREREGRVWAERSCKRLCGVLVTFSSVHQKQSGTLSVCVHGFRDSLVVMIWCELWIPSNRATHSAVSTVLAACRDSHTELSLTHTQIHNTHKIVFYSFRGWTKQMQDTADLAYNSHGDWSAIKLKVKFVNWDRSVVVWNCVSKGLSWN